MPSIIGRLNCFSKKSKKHRFTDERSIGIDDDQKLALVGSNVTSATNKMGRSESSNGSKSHLRLSPTNRQSYDDDSLPTIDSHYNQVKSGDRSLVSDAEGTFGTNNPSLTGFSQADRSAYGTIATPAQAVVGFGGNNSIEGQLLKDYYGSNQPAHLMASPIQQLKEEMLEIYAPAGRLGLVIDCPTSEDTPIVHAIKDTCPIRNEIYVGDKLVAVDDEDVREFNAVQVSRLISKKSEQKRRKLTIIRTSRGRDGMY